MGRVKREGWVKRMERVKRMGRVKGKGEEKGVAMGKVKNGQRNELRSHSARFEFLELDPRDKPEDDSAY